MKKIIKSNPILFYFVFTALIFLFMRIVFKVFNFSDNVNNLIIEGLVVIVLLLFLKYLKSLQIFKFKLSSFIHGLLLGWYTIIITIGIFILTPSENIESNLTNILLIIVFSFLIGAFEEILCRGIIFNQLMKTMPPLKAAIFSSLIFGLAHLFNLFPGYAYDQVIPQVIYAFLIGMFFAGIYYVTKNIWAVMFLHGLFDLPTNLSESQTQHTQSDLIEALSVGIFQVGLFLPALIIGIYLIKKYSRKSAQ